MESELAVADQLKEDENLDNIGAAPAEQGDSVRRPNTSESTRKRKVSYKKYGLIDILDNENEHSVSEKRTKRPDTSTSIAKKVTEASASVTEKSHDRVLESLPTAVASAGPRTTAVQRHGIGDQGSSSENIIQGTLNASIVPVNGPTTTGLANVETWSTWMRKTGFAKWKIYKSNGGTLSWPDWVKAFGVDFYVRLFIASLNPRELDIRPADTLTMRDFEVLPWARWCVERGRAIYDHYTRGGCDVSWQDWVEHRGVMVYARYYSGRTTVETTLKGSEPVTFWVGRVSQ
ncbi:MAG: hypothetical protein M1827_000505 [Pycnora praestabilis]|nr:MAG: hypothetical protein M1827_000505 [Pycnora praestabilis]